MSFLLLCTGMLINDANAEDDRKQQKTYGLGLDLHYQRFLSMNTMSVRYRVNKKITLEPMVGYSSGASSSTTTLETISYDEEENENTTSEDVTTDTNVLLEAGLNLRYQIAVRDTVMHMLCWVLIGDYRSESTTGDVDMTEKANAVGVYYGRLEGWLSENWSSSIDVFSTGYSVVTTENANSESTTTVNAFDPNFRIQLHLYF